MLLNLNKSAAVRERRTLMVNFASEKPDWWAFVGICVYLCVPTCRQDPRDRRVPSNRAARAA